MAYTIGIEFGTHAVQAIIVDCADGQEFGSCTIDYPTGKRGILLDPQDAKLARQHPGDYLSCLERAVRGALAGVTQGASFSAEDVIGIGISTTGSCPIPVDENNVPLALNPLWKDNLAAQCWLWCDKTGYLEAERITQMALEYRPYYLAKCGNVYSSEWWWSKLAHCAAVAPDVFEAASSWVELCDYIPAVLAGVTAPRQIIRGICAAGHKAMYAEDWNGLPDVDFLASIAPELAALRERLYESAFDATTPAGALSPEWARKLGLQAGTVIAIGELDVQYGAVGCGLKEGVLVKAMGNLRTCDYAIVSARTVVADIPGIRGIVKGAALPGFYGVEAGQAGVGELFKWWVEGVCLGDAALYGKLTAEAAGQKPGQHGLLALDWNSGNRNILGDSALTGLLVGQTVQTSRVDIYRALIEATAFGARIIIDRLREYGVPIAEMVFCGALAEKNPFLMQAYADITGCTLRTASSGASCALGAAIAAAVIAGEEYGGYVDFPTAQEYMTSLSAIQYEPIPANQAVYAQMYPLYRELHDAFGGVNRQADLFGVMKELIRIRTPAPMEEM